MCGQQRSLSWTDHTHNMAKWSIFRGFVPFFLMDIHLPNLSAHQFSDLVLFIYFFNQTCLELWPVKSVHLHCQCKNLGALACTKCSVQSGQIAISLLLFGRQREKHLDIETSCFFRTEVCLHLGMGREDSLDTTPPTVSLCHAGFWSWWVQRCPRSPVAGTQEWTI